MSARTRAIRRSAAKAKQDQQLDEWIARKAAWYNTPHQAVATDQGTSAGWERIMLGNDHRGWR